jgi:hypothetical protein
MARHDRISGAAGDTPRGREINALVPSGPAGPAGVDIRCPRCGWDPPPFAMERNGRRQPDGTWSLVCPADGTAIVEGIVYQGTDTGRGLILPP